MKIHWMKIDQGGGGGEQPMAASLSGRAAGSRWGLVTPVDADICLQRACRNLAQAMEDPGAEVSSAGLPRVAMVEVHLEQLFQDLLGNAIKYARKDVAPRIRVKAGANENEWVFPVQDNGIGIAPEYQQRVLGCSSGCIAVRNMRAPVSVWHCAHAWWNAIGGGSGWNRKLGVGSTCYLTLPRG